MPGAGGKGCERGASSWSMGGGRAGAGPGQPPSKPAQTSSGCSLLQSSSRRPISPASAPATRATSITSDAFKAVVTGEPIRGADKYKPAVDFRPKAQHVFACNRLPNFQSEMDRGVMRRLVLVQFDRTIPEDERIADIGQRIAREEPDLLLAWAVEGATRLLETGRFEEPASSREALSEWAYGSDPVQAFMADCVRPAFTVVGEKPHRVSSKQLFDAFESWLERERRDTGRFSIGINSLVQRVRENLPSGARYLKSNNFRGFEGLRLINDGKKRAANSTDQDPRKNEGRTRDALKGECALVKPLI